MRIINIVALITILAFINLGDTLFSGSIGRFSRDTRQTLNKLVLELANKAEKSEEVQETSKKPKKTITDEYFDRALEQAERQTYATDEYFEETSENKL